MSRVLVAAGYLTATRRGCGDGQHVGYPVGAGRIARWCEAHPADAYLWRGAATCSACQSTVQIARFARSA
jgi:hypothetical protein